MWILFLLQKQSLGSLSDLLTCRTEFQPTGLSRKLWVCKCLLVYLEWGNLSLIGQPWLESMVPEDRIPLEVWRWLASPQILTVNLPAQWPHWTSIISSILPCSAKVLQVDMFVWCEPFIMSPEISKDPVFVFACFLACLGYLDWWRLFFLGVGSMELHNLFFILFYNACGQWISSYSIWTYFLHWPDLVFLPKTAF